MPLSSWASPYRLCKTVSEMGVSRGDMPSLWEPNGAIIYPRYDFNKKPVSRWVYEAKRRMFSIVNIVNPVPREKGRKKEIMKLVNFTPQTTSFTDSGLR